MRFGVAMKHFWFFWYVKQGRQGSRRSRYHELCMFVYPSKLSTAQVQNDCSLQCWWIATVQIKLVALMLRICICSGRTHSTLDMVNWIDWTGSKGADNPWFSAALSVVRAFAIGVADVVALLSHTVAFSTQRHIF